MIPSAIAATPERSIENVSLAAARPLLAAASSDSPIRRSIPTRTSVRNSWPVGDECIPIFRSGFDCSRPGMPRSRTKLSTLRSAGGLPSSSLQMKTMVSAYGPLVMKVFDPLRTYSSPSRLAVDFIELDEGNPLLLPDGAAAQNGARRQAHRDAHRRDHAGAVAADLDDGDQGHPA